MGEETEKQRQFEEVTLRLVLTSVHIHHIADRTQGIVRNTQGQQNLHRLIGALAAKQPGNAVGALSQEIYILLRLLTTQRRPATATVTTARFLAS